MALGRIDVIELLEQISQKKKLLDSLRPLPIALEKKLYEWYKVSLTYNSNAIEGNTLSLADTAQIIEKQITVGGKTIIEHLEAINHGKAVDFIVALAQEKSRSQLTMSDILAIHATILQKINDENAGKLRTIPVRVVGSLVPCPNYAKVPLLMDELMQSITHSEEHLVTLAAYAHLQLVTIHPFIDGNGRTARLLMNLLLLQEQYPLITIEAHDRKAYISAIQKAIQGDTGDYYTFIYTAVDQSLDEYLKAIHE